uniref:M48 family metalloprotease n=1 Tax=Herbaspirillum sp. DW155 TaxID=3095609 RepID=UPI00403F80AC
MLGLLSTFCIRPFLAYSRGREYVADADGAHLTSPEMMMRALNFLPDDERDGHGIFDSHPPLKERKRRIAELQDAPARQEPAIVELVGNDT